MTLAEHQARLKAEGKWDAYVAAKTAREDEFRRKDEEYAQAEVPLVRDLRAAGAPVGSVWDLVNDADRYRPEFWDATSDAHRGRLQVLLILADHLQYDYPGAIRDGIARALAVPSAKFAWPVLVERYRQEGDQRVKQGLAVAISNIADDELIEDVIGLARDPRLGESRALLLSAIERSQLPRARKTLMELGTDPELQKEVRKVLRRQNRKR